MTITRDFLIRPVLAATAFSVCLFTHNAIAAIIVVGDSVFGADSVLRDTTNNIEFLRLDLTMGYGYAGIVTEFGVGGDFEGWGVASETDMLTLGSSVGITDRSTDPSQVALANDLRDWFCPAGTCVVLSSTHEVAGALISDTYFIDFVNEERQLLFSIGRRFNVDPNEVDFRISGYDADGTNEEVWLVRPVPLLPVEPVPDIKVNGADGPLTLTARDTLQLSLHLDNNGRKDFADWWLAGNSPYAPYGLLFWTPKTGWIYDERPAYQGRLDYVDDFSSPIIPARALAPGKYTLYFGVDTLMNTAIGWPYIYQDSVQVGVVRSQAIQLQ